MKSKLNPFPNLTTERLVLRQTIMQDSKEVLFLRSDKKVNKYIERKEPQNLQNIEKFINKITIGIEEGKNINWSITIKGNPKMIGSICLWNFSLDKTKAEVGYDLNPAFQNQGIMSEALKQVLNFGFKNLKFTEIEAYTHRENENSKRLLIKNKFKLIKNKKDIDNANNLIYSIKSTT